MLSITRLPFNVTVSGGAAVPVPFACSMMVIEEVPDGTLKVTTFPTACVPSGISVTPELGTKGLRHEPAGCAVQSLGFPQACACGVVATAMAGVEVQAGTSLHAAGLSPPQETVAARGKAQAAMQSVRIRTEDPPWATVSPTTRTMQPGAK